jgi:CheY-like chemotaxis protein
MKQPTILFATTDTWFRRDICSSLARFDYEVFVAGDDIEALAILKENRQVGVIVADIRSGGLVLAREARRSRPSLGVIYTSVNPHDIAGSEKVPGAPTLRIPYGAHQLAGVIRGLGRRVLDNTLAA